MNIIDAFNLAMFIYAAPLLAIGLPFALWWLVQSIRAVLRERRNPYSSSIGGMSTDDYLNATKENTP